MLLRSSDPGRHAVRTPIHFVMSPAIVFAYGLLLLILFGWYFATEIPARKRWLGLVLTVLLVAFCVEQFTPLDKRIRLGLDLKGGTSFMIRLVREDDRPITPDLLDQAVEVIRKRVDSLGVSEPDIAPYGEDRILVQIAGIGGEEMRQAQEQLQRVAKLEFAIVEPNSPAILAQVEAGQAIMPPGKMARPMKNPADPDGPPTMIVTNKRADFSGEHVKRAWAYFDQTGYGVSLEFDAEGAKLFDNLAAPNVGKNLAIILDGEVLTAPTLQTAHFNGRAQITGNYTEKEARDLASALENPLRVPVQIEETRSASASLGQDSIKSGVLAGLTGLALVFVFVIVYYRLAGFIALAGLIVNFVLLLGMMAMFGFVLTLPGIAGIILTIGMAVDANVLIYERLREEMAAGKSLAAALNGAYEKAFSAIFDANVTTLITSVILFIESTGSVKGFAITLTLGIVASMFSALLFTRTAFRWLVEKGALRKMSMLDIIPKRHFDFLGKRRVALCIAGALLVGSVAVVAIRGEKNLGIDFRGGDVMVVNSKVPITVAEARQAAEKMGLGSEAVFQMEREGIQEMLTIRSPEGTAAGIFDKLQEAFPDRDLTVASEEAVGARIGAEFAKRSLWALFLGMVGILIYVTVRFEFAFAIASVVGVLHDVVLTIGLFALIGGEFSLVMVGAILTVAGYSINDTIVVFDRIRESLASGEGGSIEKLMNVAINETLGRTILTGGSTLLSVAALYFFGGTVLRDFAFVIFAGVVIGTFSSIFVAAPIVLWWQKVTGKSIRREVLETEALRQAGRGAA
jgi:protein-export membrane protein, SecD/SecF family